MNFGFMDQWPELADPFYSYFDLLTHVLSSYEPSFPPILSVHASVVSSLLYEIFLWVITYLLCAPLLFNSYNLCTQLEKANRAFIYTHLSSYRPFHCAILIVLLLCPHSIMNVHEPWVSGFLAYSERIAWKNSLWCLERCLELRMNCLRQLKT